MTNKISKKQFFFELIQSLIVALFISLPFLTYEGANTKGSFAQEMHKMLSTIDLTAVLVFVLSFVLFYFLDRVHIKPDKGDTFLAILFSIFLILGCLYSNEYTWIKDYRNILRILLRFTSFAILLRGLIAGFNFGIQKLYAKDSKYEKECHFLGQHSLRNVTICLFLLWLPIIILSYPGNLTGDTLMQLWEATGEREYWAHNPLFHTMILKAFLSLGELLFHSKAAGFFMCSIAQSLSMALVLGYSLQRLYERGVGIFARRIIFAIYVLTPTYSNMATSPGKDMAYMALFLLYILFLEKIIYCLEHKESANQLTVPFWIRFVLTTVALCLVRKNGIYLVLPTGILLTIFLAKNSGLKKKALILLVCCILPFVGFKISQGFLETLTQAEPGSIREMLSIPFQQTARYLNIYGSEISEFERDAINTVLLDVDLVGRIYTPDISDPVKGLYNLDATTEDLLNYFKAWFIGLCKHPIVYFDAFFQHIYGWFYPAVVNLIRYHATDDIFTVPTFFVNMRESIKRFYELPFFALLENIGLYVWTMFWLLMKKSTQAKTKWLLFPLFFSLLICMASPAFYEQARYAYPIVIAVPFVSAIILNKQPSVEHN